MGKTLLGFVVMTTQPAKFIFDHDAWVKGLKAGSTCMVKGHFDDGQFAVVKKITPSGRIVLTRDRGSFDSEGYYDRWNVNNSYRVLVPTATAVSMQHNQWRKEQEAKA